jgi:hypothetical protein
MLCRVQLRRVQLQQPLDKLFAHTRLFIHFAGRSRPSGRASGPRCQRAAARALHRQPCNGKPACHRRQHVHCDAPHSHMVHKTVGRAPPPLAAHTPKTGVAFSTPTQVRPWPTWHTNTRVQQPGGQAPCSAPLPGSPPAAPAAINPGPSRPRGRSHDAGCSICCWARDGGSSTAPRLDPPLAKQLPAPVPAAQLTPPPPPW